MGTLHITVANQSGISGSCSWPLAASGTNYYTCPQGKFAITPSLNVSGSGSTLTITGSLSIAGVPDNYGTVTFSGTYVKDNSSTGSGTVSWTGTHPQSDQEGDGWTSDITIPEGELEARAKSQAS